LSHGHLNRHKLGLDVRVATIEALEGSSGGIDLLMADEIPGRFDGERKANGEES
jgi:hypothetical protein